MILLALCLFLGALVVSFSAGVILGVECKEEADSECTTAGYAQFGFAVTAAIVALGALVVGFLGRSRPGIWLVVSFAALVSWLLVILVFSPAYT
jgi:hypothetical protein